MDRVSKLTKGTNPMIIIHKLNEVIDALNLLIDDHNRIKQEAGKLIKVWESEGCTFGGPGVNIGINNVGDRTDTEE